MEGGENQCLTAKNIQRMSRKVSSEEKTWRTYSKSLIVELKEKLAARRARTLGLLSEGGDSSVFWEVDTESDGLDDTSTQSHEASKGRLVQDVLAEHGPEPTSLSETSSISDTEFCHHHAEFTDQHGDLIDNVNLMLRKKCFFTTTATECHSFSPPRADNTTMTSAKIRFEGDRELVPPRTDNTTMTSAKICFEGERQLVPPRADNTTMTSAKIRFEEDRELVPPRADITTMTSAKIRFEGDRELVSVGTECDGLNDSFLDSNDVSKLDMSNISLDLPTLVQSDISSKSLLCEEYFNTVNADIDSIEATYSSALEYFFGTSKESLSCTATNISTEIAYEGVLEKKDPDHCSSPDVGSKLELKKSLTDIKNAIVLEKDITPTVECLNDECLETVHPESFDSVSPGLMTEAKELNAIICSSQGSSDLKVTDKEELPQGESTIVSLGAGDFKLSESKSGIPKAVCRNLIKETEEFLRSELSKTTYKCAMEEILRLIKSDDVFYAEVDKNTVSLLEKHLDKSRLFPHGDQNVSSNSGSDDQDTNSTHESTSKGSDIISFQRNQRLQSCLKKARLVSALQMNHDTAATKVGKVVTKQAYEKAVREFEVLVTRFASTDLKKDQCSEPPRARKLDKHPHVTSLPPFGAQKGSMSSKTFVFNKEAKDWSKETDESIHSKMKRSSTFVMEEKISKARVGDTENQLGNHMCIADNLSEKSDLLFSANQDLSQTGIKANPKESITFHMKKPEKRVEDSDSESTESHESGFCSNQLYTASLLTQLLDYSSQEEDVADTNEDSKDCDEMGDQSSKKAHATEGVVDSQMTSDNLIKMEDNDLKERSENIEKLLSSIQSNATVEETPLDEDGIVYESDFETGSDSDTDLLKLRGDTTGQFDSKKDIAYTDWNFLKNGKINQSDMLGVDSTVPFIKTEEEAGTSWENVLCGGTNSDFTVSNLCLEPSIENKHLDTKCNLERSGTTTEHITDATHHSSSNTVDGNNVARSEGNSRAIDQQHISKKRLRQLLPKVDLSSSDDDSPDDINNDVSPAEILRQRQIEQVDGKLQHLKEIAKRKRKARSPLKQRLQKKEENGVVFTGNSPPSNYQGESRHPHVNKLSEDLQDSIDTKSPASSPGVPYSGLKGSIDGPCPKDIDLLTAGQVLKPESHSETEWVTFSSLLSYPDFNKKHSQDMPAIEDLIESHDGMKSHKDRHAPTTSMDSLQSDQTPKEIDAPSSDAKTGMNSVGCKAGKQVTAKSEQPLTEHNSRSEVNRNMTDKLDTDVLRERNVRQAPTDDDLNFATNSSCDMIFSRNDNTRQDIAQTKCVDHVPKGVSECSPYTKTLAKSVFEESEVLNDYTGFTAISPEIPHTDMSIKHHEPHAPTDDVLKLGNYSYESRSESSNLFLENNVFGNDDEAFESSLKTSDIYNFPNTIKPDQYFHIENVSINNQIAAVTSQTSGVNGGYDSEHIDDQIAKVTSQMSGVNGGYDSGHIDNSVNSQYAGLLNRNSDGELFQTQRMDRNHHVLDIDNKPRENKELDREDLQNPLCDSSEAYEALYTESHDTKIICQNVSPLNAFLDTSHKCEDVESQPGLQQFSNIHPLCASTSVSKDTLTIETNTAHESFRQPGGHPSFQNDSGCKHSVAPTHCKNSIEEGKGREMCLSASFGSLEPGMGSQILQKFEILERILSNCIASQTQMKNDSSLNSHPHHSSSEKPETNTEPCKMVSDNTHIGEPLGQHAQVVNVATQTIDLITQASQTEDLKFEEDANDLKNSLQTYFESNLQRIHHQLENMTSEIKALGNGCTLSTSRLDEVERTIRAFYDDMDKRKQESHSHLEEKLNTLRNEVTSAFGASVGLMRETDFGKSKEQMCDAFQAIKIELSTCIKQTQQELSTDITALKQSLDWQTKIKELAEASIEKKSVGEETKAPPVCKGMDVDTMKMRIVELTSQRDAEKVFHKITRQSLRALERDHERLREEFLGARLRRERKAVDAEPRRNFKNFISQQCSYCFNNNRSQLAQQKDNTMQKDPASAQPNPTNCSELAKKRDSELLEGQEDSVSSQPNPTNRSRFAQQRGNAMPERQRDSSSSQPRDKEMPEEQRDMARAQLNPTSPCNSLEQMQGSIDDALETNDQNERKQFESNEVKIFEEIDVKLGGESDQMT